MSEQFWDAIAPSEELDLDDEEINRELRWRTLERHLDEVERVLDVGGATGAFSIRLAKRGFRVTHLDLSAEMLERARTRASAERVTLELVQGDAADLSRFADRQFDLVLNMDGAISFSGEQAPRVIAESCRVTGKTLIVSVSNKACMVPTWIKYSMKAANRILPAVHEMMWTGSWNKDQFSENALIYPSVCGIAKLKAFTAVELTALLQANGMTVASSRSLGSLTHLLMPHGDLAIPTKQLIELCETYDTSVLPDGPGSFRRAGLLAVAHPEHRH